MWIDYSFSEVRKFHPICEKAIKKALNSLSLNKIYEVKHHEMIGPLEMDFVIKNKQTGKYLCVIEVKRTPADVQSTRYQYQAMSYVQMAAPQLEKPFYIITNLEYLYGFRYDSKRPRVFQQVLEPGLIHVGNFSDYSENTFIDLLANQFKELINNFLYDNYEYSITLDLFVEHMAKVQNNRKNWKSSLAILLYEYIRGSLLSVGRNELKDIRVHFNDIKSICEDGININFKGIFDYNDKDFLPKLKIENQLLSNIFNLGKQNTTADNISDVLHYIVCEGKTHEGKVATDIELGRIVSILAKITYGKPDENIKVMDPAAGSGNLLSAAIDTLNLMPGQIVANDIDEYLIELLNLRLGLKFPNVIGKTKSPTIMNENILHLNKDDFKAINIILLNPPYVAGINCTRDKQKFTSRIREITGKEPVTNIGQIGLEGLFLELVNSLANEDCVIACIMPKQYLFSRGKEGIALRKFLVNEFGLEIIFNYPSEGLFEAVTKNTCVIVGKKNSNIPKVKIISSLDSVQDMDLSSFYQSLMDSNKLSINTFGNLIPGVEATQIDKNILRESLNDGWRILNSELSESIDFVTTELGNHKDLQKLSELDYDIVRGQVGNSGASDLVYIDSNNELYNRFKDKITLSFGIRNAKMNKFILEEGDSKFLCASKVKEQDLEEIIEEYMKIGLSEGRQIKKEKTFDELVNIIKREERRKTSPFSILVPRTLRKVGRVHITNVETYVSTNFVIIKTRNKRNSHILGSWMTTIFYQLICEVEAKDQEGARKMEKADILETYVPRIELISDESYRELCNIVKDIEFFDLQNPVIRDIDIYWAKILFGKDYDNKLKEAQRLLKFIARRRNPI